METLVGEMTGSDMKDIRHALGEAIGRRLSLADMAKLCGLNNTEADRQTYRLWENGDGPPGPIAALLSL